MTDNRQLPHGVTTHYPTPNNVYQISQNYPAYHNYISQSDQAIRLGGMGNQAGFGIQPIGISGYQQQTGLPSRSAEVSMAQPVDSASVPNHSNEAGNVPQTTGLSDKSSRRVLILHVYYILSRQLTVCAFIVCLFSFQKKVRSFVQNLPEFLPICLYIIAVILIVIMIMWEKIQRKFPYNIILLVLFTLTYSVLFGVLAALYESEAVAQSVVTVAVTVLFLVWLTELEFFTLWRGSLLCFVSVMLMLGLTWAFESQMTFIGKVCACLVALVFSEFLVYDTHKMLEGTHDFVKFPGEHIFATLSIYVDFVMLIPNILLYFCGKKQVDAQYGRNLHRLS